MKQQLHDVGVSGLTVTEVRGCGRQGGHKAMYRGAEYAIEFLPKVKLSVVVPDSELQRVVDAIMRGAHTGKIGDGKIFITTLREIVRIRTGQRGEEAI